MAPITLLNPIHMAILDAALTEMLDDGSLDQIVNDMLAESPSMEDEVSVVAVSSGMKSTLVKIRDFMASGDSDGVVEFIESSISAAENAEEVTQTMMGELAAIKIFCKVIVELLNMMG